MNELPDPRLAEIPRRPARDPRLDVFRGLGMFIILIAHIPNNSLAEWIPARYGFSDATEIFVFCSGAASALAFGPVFDRSGWLWGTRRILKRIWEVYRAHVGVFLAVVSAMAIADDLVPGANYLRDRLNLGPFLDAPGRMIGEFLRFAYVPNYFDILPMYLVILALVPVMMALARRSTVLVALLSLVLWICATARIIDPRAESWSDRQWFFNPFAWQLVFFTGFAFVRGWLPAPPRRKGLVVTSLLVIALCLPFSCQWGFSCYGGWGYVPALADIHEWLDPVIDKSHFGILRYVHFLAVAYLVYIFAGERGRALHSNLWKPIAQVGQQTLAVFLTGLVLAQVLGVVLDVVHFPGSEFVLNLLGCAILYVVARLMSFWKASPPKDGLHQKGRAFMGLGVLAVSLGLTSGVGAGEIRSMQIPSPSLGRDLAVSVYVPDQPGPWSTLYLLHGTGGNERDWSVMGQVGPTLDAAIAQGDLLPTLVVMPDGGNSWYVDNPDPGGTGLMASAITRDLPQAIDKLFPTRACPARRAIGGTSMGGYGALLHSIDHPDVFGSAFGLSSALWRPWPDDPAERALRPTRMFRGAYGDPLDPKRFNDWNVFRHIDRYGAQKDRSAIRLAMGTNDFANLKDGNREFVSRLSQQGINLELAVDEGGHEWSLWARQLPDMLRWLGSRWAPAIPKAVCQG